MKRKRKTAADVMARNLTLELKRLDEFISKNEQMVVAAQQTKLRLFEKIREEGLKILISA